MKAVFLAAAACAVAGAAQAETQLLILGAPHFRNPGLDLANSKVPDVLAPERQREIEAVVERLAAFRPTRIALEWDATEQDKLDRAYADYLAGTAKPDRGEEVQIGFRLAKRLGLKRVEAVDWQQDLPGDPKLYRFDEWGPANGQSAAVRSLMASGAAQVAAGDSFMACNSVAGWLRYFNAPAYRTDEQAAYFRIASIGDRKTSPGAWWTGGYWARNYNILAQIDRNRVSDEDRVLALFGAGHGYFLETIARTSGRFNVVDTLAYLPPAQAYATPKCRAQAAEPMTGGRQ